MKKTGLLFVVICQIVMAQTFTKQDTLKGSYTQFRNFWNVEKYELTVEPKLEDK